MKRIRKFVIFFALGLMFLLLPALTHDANAQQSIDFASFANGFSCLNETAQGKLFDTGQATCDPDGTTNLFSYAVCTYENIIDQVLSSLYCGMQFTILQPLTALMLVFFIFVGAGFALGIIPFTAREVMLVLFKFGLVFYFATESQLTIGILYTGIMNFIQESIVVIMGQVSPDAATLSGDDGIFDKMDGIIADFTQNASIAQNATSTCDSGLVAMFLTFIASVPMLAMLAVGMAIQFIMIFFQMILGYFVAITGIMFLTALSPIFLSFALFKFTRNYFDKWAQYLLSFAIQIFVVVGFIGLMVSLNLDEDLRELFELSRPFSVVRQAEGVRVPYRDICTICEPDTFGDFGITCKNNDPIDPQALLSNPDFVEIFGSRLFKILVLAYILHKAMIAVPQVAQALSAGGYSPTMVGTDVFGLGKSTRFPGGKAAQNAGNGLTKGGSGRLFDPLVTGRGRVP